MTYIIHVRYGVKRQETKNATEVVVNPKRDLKDILKELKSKYEKELDVPFPIVEFWKITKW